jgi:chaperonin GroEL
LENPYILITEQKVNMMRELVPILEKVVAENRPVLIIAEDYDSEVIENLKMNKLHGIVKVCPVKAPSFGQYRKEVLDDIAILTGGTNLTYESGLYIPSIDIDMLGRCDKVIITKDHTTIVGGKTSKEAIERRVLHLKERLAEVKATDVDNEFMTDFLSLRISKLCGGVATVKVGGTTELEMKERKDRVDDAVAATKAAIEEGVVAGGGITLLRSIPGLDLKDKALDIGTDIVFCSLDAVFNAIVENAGLDPYELQKKIDPNNNIGFDANSEKIVNMFEAGILNPAKAERLAFETAISVLNLFLSTECIVVDEPDPIMIM